jgi:hypothetical protein
LRRKHRGKRLQITPLLAFGKAQRGHETRGFGGQKNTPAKTKNGYVPHGCKQSEFPSGPLE